MGDAPYGEDSLAGQTAAAGFGQSAECTLFVLRSQYVLSHKSAGNWLGLTSSGWIEDPK
jgi:hypothetical protein